MTKVPRSAPHPVRRRRAREPRRLRAVPAETSSCSWPPTPTTALQLMEANDVAVLVTDMRMPKMNGEQLLRIVKERYPQTIRMVVTAYSDVDPILRAINEGLVARYIVKPWHRGRAGPGAALGVRGVDVRPRLGGAAPPAARDRAARHARQHRGAARPRSEAAADVAARQHRAPARAGHAVVDAARRRRAVAAAGQHPQAAARSGRRSRAGHRRSEDVGDAPVAS